MYRIFAYSTATLLLLVALLSGCADPAAPPPDPPQGIVEYTYEVLNEYPHDTRAFTQGLVWADTALLEGTGLTNLSNLRRVRLETGEVLQSRNTPQSAFGEGVTIVGDRIYQLTWTEKVAFVYDATTFDLLDEFRYDTQGWGLTHDGNRLIMSDGSATISFRDFDTFEVIREIKVTDESGPVTNLNELEYIDGYIYSNVWKTNFILIISPTTGDVVGRIDCSAILANPPEVLNGIAYDQENERLFITGKLWPTLFHIRLVKKD